MSKGTSCQKAIKQWEETHGESAAEAKVVKINFIVPPIDKMDPQVLNSLVACEKLSLSSNAIDKMVNLPNLRNLKVLSLSRNQIKKITGLEEVGQTLEELWLSYNNIEKLDGLQPCQKLTTLYIGNNKIKNIDEVDKLKDLPELGAVVFGGNPMYQSGNMDDNRVAVLKKIPSLKNIDGLLITDKFKEKINE
mmetsp:Transcript_3752/g.3186  ORF Transcript_3752/g.3186 Transcript_3752/m.3186 type:complete len:192 (+) Transcript_3752:34-609(+)